MRIEVVLNGAAGALVDRPAEAVTAELAPLFAAAGADATITVARGEAIRGALLRAAAARPDALVVGGGDGSIRAAARVAMRAGLPLGILPLGTANLLARDLGIPLTPAAAIPALVAGATRRIDVATVNGSLFLNSVLIGLAPIVTRRREALRHRSGLGKWLTLARVFLRAFDRGPRLRVLLRIDGRPVRHEARAIAVSNNPLRAGWGAIHGRAGLDTGRLGLYLTKARTRFDLWRQVFRLVTGSWQSDRAVEAMVVARLDIAARSRHLWISVDGENRLLATPLRFRIRPGALSVLAPPGEDRA
jgi:diacylglycerol kinase family enzyme